MNKNREMRNNVKKTTPYFLLTMQEKGQKKAINKTENILTVAVIKTVKGQ